MGTKLHEPATEVLEGYVVDVACLRKYPCDDWPDRAREHTTKCALMGHCIESGYGLVADDGRATLLDQSATPHVVNALGRSGRERGIRLRVTREREEHEMRTTRVSEID